MTWTVRYLPGVFDDLSRLDNADRQAVLKAIRKKLTTAPESYGEPLRKELFGYWKLRVGAVRVVYRVEKATITVLIVKVGLRRNSQVYEDLLQRLRRSP